MNLTYAIADLHGAFNLLELALAAIDRHAAAAPAGSRTVVFLGDYIDRGPQSRQIIERLMAGAPEGWRWVCLKGNHEDMMVGAYDGTDDFDWWVDNGGQATLDSYGSVAGEWGVPDAHIAWMKTLPPLAIDKHRVFVHAGVDPMRPLDEQTEQTMLWSRASNALGHAGRFVVHGHTPKPRGPVSQRGCINLDTYAWSTGRLVVGVFDDDRAGGAIDLFEVRREPK